MQREVARIPLSLGGPRPFGLMERLRWLATGRGRIQELISGSISDSTYVLERLSKDQDVTERQLPANRIEKIKKIRTMYKGEAQYGNIACASVVNFNRAFQWANGLIVVGEEDEAGQKPEEELGVVQDFLDFNDLNEEQGLLLGAEGELSGQVLLRWAWDRQAQQVRVWAVPLVETQYKAVYRAGDFTTLEKMILFPGTDQEEEVPGKDCVFIRFRGILNGTYGVPTPLPCLSQMENIDKGREDLRKVNHLFSFPTPVITGKTEARVNYINGIIASLNWKIGKALVMLAGETMSYAEISGVGSDQLIKEIQLNMQQTSAVTDVPVHFLGYPDLLSNRSTSTDMFEGPVKRAMSDQRVWMGGFEELLDKVLPLYAFQLQKKLDARRVAIAFPPVRTGNLEDLVAAWLPVRVSREISHKLFLEKLGIREPDRELRQLLREQEQELQAQGGSRRPTPEEEEQINERIAQASLAARGGA